MCPQAGNIPYLVLMISEGKANDWIIPQRLHILFVDRNGGWVSGTEGLPL